MHCRNLLRVACEIRGDSRVWADSSGRVREHALLLSSPCTDGTHRLGLLSQNETQQHVQTCDGEEEES